MRRLCMTCEQRLDGYHNQFHRPVDRPHCQASGAHLHGVEHFIMGVVNQFDRSVGTLSQVLDNEILVDEHIALRGRRDKEAR